MEVQTVKGSSGKTCVVLCKLPNGLHLDLPGKEKGELTERVSVRGSNAGAVDSATGDQLFPGRRAAGGYGITTNVSEEFFDKWLERNRPLDIVRNGWILKAKDLASAAAMGKDRAKEANGLEPMNPDKPQTGLEKSKPFEYPDA